MKLLGVIAIFMIWYGVYHGSQVSHKINLAKQEEIQNHSRQVFRQNILRALVIGCTDGIQTIKYLHKNVKDDEQKICDIRMKLFQKELEKY